MDFIGFSLNLQCWEVCVDSILDFRTDHKLIWAATTIPTLISSRERIPCIRHWKPGSGWEEASEALLWNWDEWDQMTLSWNRIALVNFSRPAKQQDFVLQSLLQLHKGSSPAEKRGLNRQIWRRRRWIKRQKAKLALHTAGETGRFPSIGPKNISVNWYKLCGEVDPATKIHDFYEHIYSLGPIQREAENL